jgi:hypothetical protein
LGPPEFDGHLVKAHAERVHRRDLAKSSGDQGAPCLLLVFI